MASTRLLSFQPRLLLARFPLPLSLGWLQFLDAPRHCVLTLCLHHFICLCHCPLTCLIPPPTGTGLFVTSYITTLTHLVCLNCSIYTSWRIDKVLSLNNFPDLKVQFCFVFRPDYFEEGHMSFEKVCGWPKEKSHETFHYFHYSIIIHYFHLLYYC